MRYFLLGLYRPPPPWKRYYISQLKKWIKEGVATIVPHVAWAIIKLWKGVLSKDTDNVALILHYIPYVIEQGHEAIVASILNKDNCNYI